MDYTLDDTFHVSFTTLAFATGIPTVLAGSPVVSAYENDSDAQITAGITLGVSHDGVVGFNLLTVDTSAAGYEDGKDYQLVITTGTVDGVSVVGTVVGIFSLGRIADGVWDERLTGSTHNIATSAGRRLRQLGALVLHDGVAQAGAANTITLDALASALDDFYVNAKIVVTAGTGSEQERIITDYVGSTRIATIAPAWITDPDNTSEFDVIPATSHSETNAGGYDNGQIFISPTGSTGTQLFVDGIVTNPIDDGSFANARTIADALGLVIFHPTPGSAITLAQAYNSFEFFGAGYTVDLGGQDVGGTRFIRGSISGIGTGSLPIVFRECLIPSDTSLDQAVLLETRLDAVLSLTSAAPYVLNQCFSADGMAVLDFTSALGQTVSLTHWSGAVEVRQMGVGGTDVMYINGNGMLTINANCTGGTIFLRGNISVTDNSGGAVTLVDDARVTRSDVVDDVWDEVLTGATHNVTNSSGKRLRQAADVVQAEGTITDAAATTTVFTTSLTEVDDFYNDSLIKFLDGALAGQVRPIKDYANSGGTITLDEGTTSAVANGVSFNILADHVHPITQIQEAIISDATPFAGASIATILAGAMSAAQLAAFGEMVAGSVTGFTAITGTLSFTQMTTDLTETTDDHYIGRTVIWTSGILAGQASDITDYVGATKLLTFTAVTEAPSNGDKFVLV